MGDRFLARSRALLESKRNATVVNASLALAIAAALLFLPPVSACSRITANGFYIVGPEGGAVLDPDGAQMTITGAASGIQAKLVSLPRLDFLEGKIGEEYFAPAMSLPSHLTIKGPIYHLHTMNAGYLPRNPGSGASMVLVSVPVPNDAEPYSALALYEWTGNAWRFVPSHVIPEDELIEAHLDYLPGPLAVFHQEPVVPDVSADVTEAASLDLVVDAVTELNPLGLYLLEGGSLAGHVPAAIDGVDPGVAVVPVVQNWGPDGVVRSDYTDNMLAIREIAQAHIDHLVNYVTRNDFTGIELDYREINPQLRDQFTQFVGELAARLHENGKTLGVRVSLPVQIAEDRWTTGPFDWRALGRHVDRLVVPAPPELDAYAQDGKLASMLTWAAGEVERYLLHVAVPALSREQVFNYTLYRPYEEILESLGSIVLEPGSEVGPAQAVRVRLSGLVEWSGVQYDPDIHTHWFSYKDAGGLEHVVHLEDPASLAYELALIGSYRMRGVVVTGSGQHPQTWEVLADFRDLVIGEPDRAVALALAMDHGERRELPAGTAVLEMQAPEKEGSYLLKAAMSVGNYVAEGSLGAALSVLAPTPTPTPVPEPTATPVPPPTATPAPQPTPAPQTQGEPAEPAEAPPPTATPAPQVVAPPPSGGTGFGYGIQAHMIHNGQAPQVMSMIQGMGFNWIKQQVEWKLFEPSKGNYQWGAIDEVVNAANAAGIHVLLSVVKAPAWARGPSPDLSVEGPPANLQDFADFLGAMAAHFRGRVRAYEVWNEQNLHYEWGNEPIDAGRYVQMLKLCYAAIKANDPNALVISGALTPTGAQPPVGMDDFAYLEQMYQAGMRNYCDGVGAHPSGYNVSPDVTWQGACEFITARESIFRGPCDTPHHSWSFRSTMEGYRNIMAVYGDAGKKIWPTEFGWASSPTPAQHYEYAADNSLQDQADWTVRAYQMSRNWGWVGPMFLWNLNFKVVAPGSEQAQWGIVDEGWGPLPAYHALAAMPK